MIIGQFAPRERQKCFFHFFKISSFGKMQIFQPKKLYTAHKIDFGAFYGPKTNFVDTTFSIL